jgi:Bacterial transcriptional activator domain
MRMAAVEARFDAELETGRNAGIIPELEAMIAEHPLREGLRGQLILALYRDGRQAEALEVYRETRRLLRDELGLEPSPALRDLERAILRQDPSLAPAIRQREPLDTMPPSRWRWPRSPLVAVPVLLLLAAGGFAAAKLATPSEEPSALAFGEPPGGFTFVPETPTHPVADVRTTTVRTSVTVEKRQSRNGAARTQARVLIVHKLPNHAPQTVAGKRSKASRHHNGTASSRHAKPPSKPKVYWLADDFGDPSFDSALWNLHGHGSGVDVKETNGQLQFDIAAGVVWDPSVEAVEQHYATNCYLTGNFDARVGFRLLDWPKDDGVLVGFGVYFAPLHEAYWSINRQGGSQPGLSEGYWFWYGNRGEWAPSADLNGALRLTRENGVLDAYYRHGRGWAMLGSGLAPGPTSLILSFGSHPDQFGYAAAGAAYDNFQATATSLRCPPGTPVPPRRRSPW